MNPTDALRALERSPSFRGIPAPVLHGISMFGELRALRAGEVLVAAQAPANAAWIVASGQLQCGGDLATVGAWVGHIDLLCDRPTHGSWTAQGPASVLEFSRASWDALLREQGAGGSAFRRSLIIGLSDALRGANHAVAEFVAQNPGAAARPTAHLLRELSALLGGVRAAEDGRKR